MLDKSFDQLHKQIKHFIQSMLIHLKLYTSDNKNSNALWILTMKPQYVGKQEDVWKGVSKTVTSQKLWLNC